MLQTQIHVKDRIGRSDFVDEPGQNEVSVFHLIPAARRQMIPFIACCLAAVALGALYLATAVPLYTASVEIMIDNRHVRAVQALSTLSDSKLETAGEVESQVEVLRSRQVALAVIKLLMLTEDPAFVNPPKSWIGEIWGKLGLATDIVDHENDSDAALRRQETALATLDRNLEVSRVGHTFVLQLEYTASDPALAAEITNGFANSYMLEQLNSRVEATHRARSWLQQRTEELRQLSVEADLAAQKFRADNGLLATKGMLVSEQQFNEMTTQLVAAREATEQARARYLRIKNVIDTHQTESAVTESLANPVINGLRTKYLDASKHKSDLERKLAPDHIAVVNLKNTIDELSTLLFQELTRVAETYKNDYEVAAAREKALANNLSRQQGVAIAANDAQAKLRQLEQKAESYKVLYQNYLQRYQEAAQQESFPMADAHVITEASRPSKPSQPRKPLVIAFSLLLGAAAGVGVGMLRERMDRVFRTIEQVRRELGVEVIGMLPLLPCAASSRPRKVEAAWVDPNSVMGDITPVLGYSIDHPFSAYVETLRSAKVAADLALKDRSPKVIGVVSLLPEEGKSTTSKNFASLLALESARTLLIDGDTRNPGLTRGIGCESRKGTQSEPSLPPRLAELLKYEPESGLQILPCIYAKDDPRVAAGFSSATLQALLQNINQSYEYVIIDLPPVGPVVNARGIASAIDAFIFVVAWGKTSRGAVRTALAKEHSIREKLLGVILNKVDMDKLDIYEHFGSDGYYHRQYKNYFKRKE